MSAERARRSAARPRARTVPAPWGCAASQRASVQTLPAPVEKPEDVVVGRHGIILSQGRRKGLLLPQVPLEYKWDRETFLRHGCLKAGLPPDAWKKGARIEVFEAEVFGE